MKRERSQFLKCRAQAGSCAPIELTLLTADVTGSGAPTELMLLTITTVCVAGSCAPTGLTLLTTTTARQSENAMTTAPREA